MTVECIRAFRDLKADRWREVGDRFEASAERFRALNATEYGQLVREVRTRRKAKDD